MANGEGPAIVVSPPSMVSTWPVTNQLSSLARYSAPAAMSAGCAGRSRRALPARTRLAPVDVGGVAGEDLRRHRRHGRPRHDRVDADVVRSELGGDRSRQPEHGRPWPPSRRAVRRRRRRRPGWTWRGSRRCGGGSSPPRRASCRAAYRAGRRRSSGRRRPCSSRAIEPTAPMIPALLNITSSCPNSATASSTAARTSGSSVTSVRMNRAASPSSAASCAALLDEQVGDHDPRRPPRRTAAPSPHRCRRRLR